MKKLNRITVGALIITLAVIVPLAGQKAQEEKPMMHQEMMCRIQLNLSPEQQEKIQKMKLEFQKEMLTMRTELKTKMLDLRALMMEKADAGKINAMIDEIAKARAEIQKKAYAHRQEVRNILNEEQKKIFDKMAPGHFMFGMKGCTAAGCRSGHMGHNRGNKMKDCCFSHKR